MCINRAEFLQEGRMPTEDVRDSFLMDRGEWSVKDKVSFPDIPVIGWLCFILGKCRLL